MTGVQATSVTLERFLALLDGVKQSGDGAVACCPAHEDENPSLSIRLGNDGRVLIHCHRGCTFEEIVAAVGLSPRDLAPDSNGTAIRPTSNAKQKKSADWFERGREWKGSCFERCHTYTDEAGVTLAEKWILRDLSTGKKSALWRHREAGCWYMGAGPAAGMPFGLDRLRAAFGDQLFLVEGEKDAETLWDRGLLASTAPNGAEQKRIPQRCLDEWRVFDDVTILIDNDGPGWTHGANQYRKLRVGRTARIKRPTRGKDISDHLAAGGTLDECEDVTAQVAGKLPPEEEDRESCAEVAVAGKPEVTGFKNTDIRNAHRFAAAYIDSVRYVGALGGWHFWDGRRWVRDDVGEAMQKVKALAINLCFEALRESNNDFSSALVKHAIASQQYRKLVAALALASSEPGIVKRPSDFDRDPWLLNVTNGTIDLKTGDLRRHNRDALITKLADVQHDPEAKCPRWESFLKEVFLEDADLIDWFQRVVGYTLTGDTSEELFFVLVGDGSNGKSTLLKVLRRLLGDYAKAASIKSFVERRGESIPNDLACLVGARFVTASESERRHRLNAGMIKELTGNDTIQARFLHREFFEFDPCLKLWLCSNHKPNTDGSDAALFRRLRLIPFNASFYKGKRDKHLGVKLKAELSGILNWGIKGCLKWQERGLEAPGAVRDATELYRKENDHIASFLEETFEFTKVESDVVSSERLRSIYEAWCSAQGERARSTRDVAQELRKRGAKVGRKNKARLWKGIKERGDT